MSGRCKEGVRKVSGRSLEGTEVKRCFKKISRVFQWCSKQVLNVFQYCFKGVSRMIEEFYEGVESVFQREF